MSPALRKVLTPARLALALVLALGGTAIVVNDQLTKQCNAGVFLSFVEAQNEQGKLTAATAQANREQVQANADQADAAAAALRALLDPAADPVETRETFVDYLAAVTTFSTEAGEYLSLSEEQSKVRLEHPIPTTEEVTRC